MGLLLGLLQFSLPALAQLDLDYKIQSTRPETSCQRAFSRSRIFHTGAPIDYSLRYVIALDGSVYSLTMNHVVGCQAVLRGRLNQQTRDVQDDSHHLTLFKMEGNELVEYKRFVLKGTPGLVERRVVGLEINVFMGRPGQIERGYVGIDM